VVAEEERALRDSKDTSALISTDTETAAGRNVQILTQLLAAQEVVAEEERALRDSEDTSELIRTGDNITRYFKEQDNVGGDELEEDEEEVDSWEQDERDEEVAASVFVLLYQLLCQYLS